MTLPHPDQTYARGLLLTMAIGDAHGMAYEFLDDPAAAGPNDLTYKANPGFPAYQAAHYSDDTQMSLVNAQLLLKHAPAALTPEIFADAWVRQYQLDPRPGYSRFMAKTLTEAADGADLMRRLNPSGGVTSGGAMRAGPFGLLPDVRDVERLAALQARVTHDTPTGILSAQAVSLAVHAMHYNLCDKAALPAFIDGRIGDAWRTLDDGDNPNNGLYIIRRAFDLVLTHDTLSGILRGGAGLGPKQDTDTVSAIAMAIAARARGMTNDVPAHLVSELENKAYGRDFLAALDGDLLRRFPAPPVLRPGPLLQPF